MAGIPLTRCQFLMPFADIHSEIGAHTTSLLARFRLPTSLEEKANHFIPILLAVRFAEVAQNTQGILDFGFHAAKKLHYCHLSERTRNAIAHAPTLFAALQQTCKWATFEDTILRVWLERHDDHVRICSKLDGTAGLHHLEHSQWLQNIFPVYIVRQFVGQGWAPATMAFEARYAPRPEVRSFWPNTRFLSGQESSWIDVPVPLLSLPNLMEERPPDLLADEAEPADSEIIGTLKKMLPSYLDEAALTVAEIAEMAGTSVRSLQRRLSAANLSYSDLLETARFENATRLLRDTDAKIIEVAFSSGYTDPAHFSRAFRRISGVSPRQFREQWRPR